MTDVAFTSTRTSGTGFFTSLFAKMRAANDARHTRRALNFLSDRELNDIGITRGDIDAIALGFFTR